MSRQGKTNASSGLAAKLTSAPGERAMSGDAAARTEMGISTPSGKAHLSIAASTSSWPA
jgi:hypothetical protein